MTTVDINILWQDYILLATNVLLQRYPNLMRVIYSHFVTSTATDLAMIHCNRHLSTRFASVTHSHTYANRAIL